MKTVKSIFWISTAILSVMMLVSAVNYFLNPEVIANFEKMGFQNSFRIELGIAKILGAFALLFPFVPNKLREWAYAGFAITFLSATIMHLSMHDPIAMVIAPLIFMVILFVSYFSRQRMLKQIPIKG